MRLQCTRNAVDAILDRGAVSSQEERALLGTYFSNTMGATNGRIDCMRNGVLNRIIRIAQLLQWDLPEDQLNDAHDDAAHDVCLDVMGGNDYSQWEKLPDRPWVPCLRGLAQVSFREG